ncbi:MAG: hypothetical protein ABJ251_19685 [Paracoccaceae bacterium]
MKRPEDDLEARKEVWDAMHVLWLDTDVEGIHLATSAQCCAKTAYTIAELEHIYWHEVYPVMRSNLWSVAGEWQPLELDALSAEILKRHRFGRAIWFKRFRHEANENWKQLRSKIEAARSDG